MKLSISKKAALGVLGAVLIAAPAFGQEAQSFMGMILSTDSASQIVVRTTAGDKTVTLSPDTKIQGTKGAGVLQREKREASDLIRGLAVEVKGSQSGDAVAASSIEFKTSDLKTAKQIQAGLHDTEGQVAANKQAIAEQEARLNNVGNLVAAGRTKVFFPVGGAKVDAKGKEDLCALAEQAKAQKGGYRLAIVGRADPTGDVAANKRLSARRAVAVKEFLLENCGVLPGNFVPPTALGEATVALDPDPPKSNDEARRVTVTIMVSGANAPAAN